MADAWIPITGPPGLKVPDDPRVVLRHTMDVDEELSAPDPDDPFVVCFTDPEHFRREWTEARSTAQEASQAQRSFGIVIERAEVLPTATIDLLGEIRDAAGLRRISVGVQRLR